MVRSGNFTCLKLLELPLNCPPWLEKSLNFTCFKLLELPLNCPSWLEKILNFTCLKLSELHNFQGFQGVVFKEFQGCNQVAGFFRVFFQGQSSFRVFQGFRGRWPPWIT